MPAPDEDDDAAFTLPIQEQLLHINVQWFRGGLVCKAHRPVCHSTLGLRVMKKKKRSSCPPSCTTSALSSRPYTERLNSQPYYRCQMRRLQTFARAHWGVGGEGFQTLNAQYRGTSLIRNTPLLGPYSRTIPRVVWWS